MYQAPTPLCSLLKLEVNYPDGSKKLLGYQFHHRNPVISFLIGFPLQLHLAINTARHNAKFPLEG